MLEYPRAIVFIEQGGRRLLSASVIGQIQHPVLEYDILRPPHLAWLQQHLVYLTASDKDVTPPFILKRREIYRLYLQHNRVGQSSTLRKRRHDGIQCRKGCREALRASGTGTIRRYIYILKPCRSSLQIDTDANIPSVQPNWQCPSCASSPSEPLCDDCRTSWIHELKDLDYSDAYEARLSRKLGVAGLVMGLSGWASNVGLGWFEFGDMLGGVSVVLPRS